MKKEFENLTDENLDLNDNPNIVNLIDEDGYETPFEIILTLEAEGKEYAILMPLEENEDEEALIFRIEKDSEGDVLVAIDNDEEYQIVVDVYETLMDEEDLNY